MEKPRRGKPRGAAALAQAAGTLLSAVGSATSGTADPLTKMVLAANTPKLSAEPTKPSPEHQARVDQRLREISTIAAVVEGVDEE